MPLAIMLWMAPQRVRQLRDKKRSNDSIEYFPSKNRPDRHDYVRRRSKPRSRSCSLASCNNPAWERQMSIDDESAMIKPGPPDPTQCPRCLNYSLVVKPITNAMTVISFICFPIAIFYRYYAKRKHCKICHAKFK